MYLLNLYRQVFGALLLLSMVATAAAQTNLTGIWEGKFLATQTELGPPKLVVEILYVKDDFFSGITHLYYDDNKYEHYKMVGIYNKTEKLLMFKETATIAIDLGIYKNCLGTYTMVLNNNGSNMFLYGNWVPNIKDCTNEVKVWLFKRKPVVKLPLPGKKNVTPAQPPVTEKKIAAPLKNAKTKAIIPAAPVPPAALVAPVAKNIPSTKTAPVILPAKITQRETDVQSLIEIAFRDKDSIRVEVYDNGDIDGDSVSVYEEQVQRINKKMITAKPIIFYVSLDKNINPITHLRLVAESLGAIPPCTALMIVTTKSKRYEVRLSSNFNKNATVELFLKE